VAKPNGVGEIGDGFVEIPAPQVVPPPLVAALPHVGDAARIICFRIFRMRLKNLSEISYYFVEVTGAELVDKA